MEFVEHLDHLLQGQQALQVLSCTRGTVSVQWLSIQAQLDTARGSRLGHMMRKSKCEDEVNVWEQISLIREWH
jgi:hypothetical protein